MQMEMDFSTVKYEGQYFTLERTSSGLSLVVADDPKELQLPGGEKTYVLTLTDSGVVRHGEGVPPGFDLEGTEIGSCIPDMGPL